MLLMDPALNRGAGVAARTCVHCTRTHSHTRKRRCVLHQLSLTPPSNTHNNATTHRDMERFGKLCKLVAFKPFPSAASALEQINAVSEAQVTDDLKAFLETNMPKVRVCVILICMWCCTDGSVSGATLIACFTQHANNTHARTHKNTHAGEGGQEGQVQAGRVRP